MITNFIEQRTRRTTRNLFIANVLLVGAIVALVALNVRYLYNLASGPFTISREALLGISDVGERQEYYVTVNGDEVLDTGAQEVTSSSRGGIKTGERVTARYVAMLLTDRLLLVKAPVSDTGTTVTGALVPIPQNVQREIVDPIVQDEPRLDGVFLSYMLDAGDFRSMGYLGLAIGAVLMLLALWNLTKAARRATNPEAHPTYLALGAYGPVQAMVASVDAEAGSPSSTWVGKTLITPHWLVRTTLFGVDVIRAEDIVWIYKKVTQRRVYFVPAGKSHAAVLWNKQGKPAELMGNEEQVTNILATVARQVPWALVGYTAELDKAWRSDRQAVVQAVADRQRELRSQSVPGIAVLEEQRG